MEEVRIEYMDVAKLKGWPRNPKAHDIPGIKASLRRFGFVDPIAVDETTKRIVAGHGRLEAVLELKAEGEPPPRRVKRKGKAWLVPVLRGATFADDTEAEAYLVADNALTMLAGWEDAELVDLLQDMGNLEGTGYDPAALEALVAELGPSDDDFEGERPPEVGADSEGFRVPKANVMIVIGTFKVKVARADYEAWLQKIRLDVGSVPLDIGAEIVRRLGI